MSGFKYGIVRYDQDPPMNPARARVSIMASLSEVWMRDFFLNLLVAPLFFRTNCPVFSITTDNLIEEAGEG